MSAELSAAMKRLARTRPELQHEADSNLSELALSTGYQHFLVPGEQERIDAVCKYHRDRTLPNLIRIFSAVESDELRALFLALLRNCNTWHPDRPKRIRCGIKGCPICGKRLKKKAKRESLKRIIAKTNGTPDPAEISFVTIDGPRISLDPDEAEQALSRFRPKLRLGFRKQLPLCSADGYFDVSMRGLMHWHGVVIHPGLSREEVRKKLKRAFPGRRMVDVAEWRNDRAFIENMESVIDYSLVAERHTKLYNGSPVFGRDQAEFIVLRIIAIEAMSKRGLSGLRLCVNMRSRWKWKNDVLFDPVTRESIVVREMQKSILGNGRKKRVDRQWNRADRPALWPRRIATDRIQGVRPSVTN